jgi:NADH-quinone oxidoreductase subunit K
MIVPFGHVLALSGIVFLMGVFCAVSRRNLIMILLGLEIMLNGATIAFVGASLHFQALEGQTIALFIMAAAAAEVSVGLALFVCIYKKTGSLDPRKMMSNPKTELSDQ